MYLFTLLLFTEYFCLLSPSENQVLPSLLGDASRGWNPAAKNILNLKPKSLTQERDVIEIKELNSTAWVASAK